MMTFFHIECFIRVVCAAANLLRTSLFAALLSFTSSRQECTHRKQEKEEKQPSRISVQGGGSSQSTIRISGQNIHKSNGRSDAAENAKGERQRWSIRLHTREAIERYEPTAHRIHIQRWTRIFIDLAAHGCLWAAEL